MGLIIKLWRTLSLSLVISPSGQISLSTTDYGCAAFGVFGNGSGLGGLEPMSIKLGQRFIPPVKRCSESNHRRAFDHSWATWPRRW
jgi:hypothetical protein